MTTATLPETRQKLIAKGVKFIRNFHQAKNVNKENIFTWERYKPHFKEYLEDHGAKTEHETIVINNLLKELK